MVERLIEKGANPFETTLFSGDVDAIMSVIKADKEKIVDFFIQKEIITGEKVLSSGFKAV